MSTNIRGLEFMVKDRLEHERLRPLGKAADEIGQASENSVVEQAHGRSKTQRKEPLPAGQVVSCRLPAEEVRAFDALCDQMGAKSRSDGLRSLVRMASGFLEFSRADSERLDEIRYELGKIGTNVNQIALAANRGRTPMVRAQWQAITDLRRVLPDTMRVLGQIIAERRRQGAALFRGFAEAEGVHHG